MTEAFKTTVLIMLALRVKSFNFQETGNQCSKSQISAGMNDLGFAITEKLNEKGNIFISPFSIYTALAMLYPGARSESARQIEQALRLSPELIAEENFQKSMQSIIELYKQANADYKLEVADGLFIQEGFSVKKEFVSNLTVYYHAEVGKEDFALNEQQAMDEINAFVDKSTNGVISEFLTSPLDPSTVMVILNAIYFKGMWKVFFDEEHTKEGQFFVTPEDSKQTQFMHLYKVEFPFYEDTESGFQYLEMPYSGDDISMLLALPGTIQASPALSMTSSVLCDIQNNLLNTTLEQVTIPKFQLEYQIELNDTLSAIGITDIFNVDRADLSGISDEKLLEVSSVLHQAYVDVNEQGTEAAAVTAIITENIRARVRNTEFIADHPFFFYILDKRTRIVLFSGRFSDPE